ncbi:hypothetical protein V502_08238 [Pseudogymnoascus sp. VKM F-4520 (FW-2644)]|nr:hypothetical protein V502_08238 [Pseudogymnoascus sp. VKM F-4520 (FW-2644)]
MTPPRRYSAATPPASPAATSEQQLACACPDNRENRAWHACVNNTTDADHQQPSTTNHRQPSPTITVHIPATPSRTFLLHRRRPALGSAGHHPEALPRPYQACAKPAPRSAGGLARCGAEGALSVPLIGCGGCLMRLGGCRLQQPSAATDS